MPGMAEVTAGSGRGTRRPRYWTQAGRENPLARFIPFSSMVSPHDVITRGGDYLRVWRLEGVPFECADESLLAERHEALCHQSRTKVGNDVAVEIFQHHYVKLFGTHN